MVNLSRPNSERHVNPSKGVTSVNAFPITLKVFNSSEFSATLAKMLGIKEPVVIQIGISSLQGLMCDLYYCKCNLVSSLLDFGSSCLPRPHPSPSMHIFHKADFSEVLTVHAE